MKNWKRPLQVTALAAALATAAGGTSRAELIFGYGTAGSDPSVVNLFTFDSATPGTLNTIGGVTGLGAGFNLVGIDFRPAFGGNVNGQLYGLGYNPANGTAQIYTINTGTGVATLTGGGLTLTLGAANNGTGGDSFGIGFNPTVDRLRIITGNGSNFRLNVDTGALLSDTQLAYIANDPGNVPQIAGADYLGGRLFDIDIANNFLAEQTNPNGGQLTGIGGLGITLAGAGTLGFDISPSSGLAFLQSDTNDAGVQDDLYTVNLNTGAATLVGAIGAAGFNTYGIAVVPEPSTYALVGGALALGLGSVWRRRRQQARVA